MFPDLKEITKLGERLTLHLNQADEFQKSVLISLVQIQSCLADVLENQSRINARLEALEAKQNAR